MKARFIFVAAWSAMTEIDIKNLDRPGGGWRVSVTPTLAQLIIKSVNRGGSLRRSNHSKLCYSSMPQAGRWSKPRRITDRWIVGPVGVLICTPFKVYANLLSWPPWTNVLCSARFGWFARHSDAVCHILRPAALGNVSCRSLAACVLRDASQSCNTFADRGRETLSFQAG